MFILASKLIHVSITILEPISIHKDEQDHEEQDHEDQEKEEEEEERSSSQYEDENLTWTEGNNIMVVKVYFIIRSVFHIWDGAHVTSSWKPIDDICPGTDWSAEQGSSPCTADPRLVLVWSDNQNTEAYINRQGGV